MRRGDSAFVSQTPQRIDRVLLPPPGDRGASSFVRRVPMAPGVRPIGLEPAPERYDPRPSGALPEQAPQLPGYYLGVVEEIGEDGLVHTKLWETPNGRAFLVVLDRRQGEWSGEETPTVGDQLRVHTWTELPGASALGRVERMRVEVLRAPMSERERAMIGDAIRSLEGEGVPLTAEEGG